jgi:WD40 repeat protein
MVGAFLRRSTQQYIQPQRRVSRIYTHLTAKNVRRSWKRFRSSQLIIVSSAHSDAVWDLAWTGDDKVISVSADGSIKQWDVSSGQVLTKQPPHTLGLVSLSVSPSGQHALYNSIEGLTFLWDLQSGDIVGQHASYARNDPESNDPGTRPDQPLSCHPINHLSC